MSNLKNKYYRYVAILLVLGLFGCSTTSVKQETQTKVLVEVDFSKPSDENRLFVYKNNELVMSAHVSHGINSGAGKYATKFSNDFNSLESSLGTYKIVGTYYGKHGKSFRLEGLSPTNSNVEARDVVVHSASYVNDQTGEVGHSFGCFAVSPETMKYLLENVPVGTVIVAHD